MFTLSLAVPHPIPALGVLFAQGRGLEEADGESRSSTWKREGEKYNNRGRCQI